jgi:hypothetical protein
VISRAPLSREAMVIGAARAKRVGGASYPRPVGERIEGEGLCSARDSVRARLEIPRLFVILRMRASRAEERISDSFARREAGSGSWSAGGLQRLFEQMLAPHHRALASHTRSDHRSSVIRPNGSIEKCVEIGKNPTLCCHRPTSSPHRSTQCDMVRPLRPLPER